MSYFLWNKLSTTMFFDYYTNYKSSSVTDLKAFSFLVLEIKIPRTAVDYTVRRHQETERSRAGRAKTATRAENNFISHHLVWQKTDCSKLHNWTNVMKKCVNIHCEEKAVKLAKIAELLSRNYCWKNQNNVKRLQ